MRLWYDVFAEIGKNIGLLLLMWMKQIWAFLRLGVIFRVVFRILGLPYEWFRKYSEDRRVDFVKHAAPQHRAGAFLLELFFLPYNCYLASTDGLGESEYDRETLKFWFTIGWLSIPVAILVFIYLMNYHKFTG